MAVLSWGSVMSSVQVKPEGFKTKLFWKKNKNPQWSAVDTVVWLLGVDFNGLVRLQSALEEEHH